MQSSNLVMFHGKAALQRVRHSQIVMTQKKVPHVLSPCSYTTLCVYRPLIADHSLQSQDNNEASSGSPVQMSSRKLNSILLLPTVKSSAEIWV